MMHKYRTPCIRNKPTNHKIQLTTCHCDRPWFFQYKKQEILASKALEKRKWSGWGRAKLEEKEEVMGKEVEVGTLLMLPCRESGSKPLIFMVKDKNLEK